MAKGDRNQDMRTGFSRNMADLDGVNWGQNKSENTMTDEGGYWRWGGKVMEPYQ